MRFQIFKSKIYDLQSAIRGSGAWHLAIVPQKGYSGMKSITLKVYLQPKSSKNEIVGAYQDGIKVKVSAPPIEGSANKTLIRFLAKELGISSSSIEIIKGHHSREKTLRISGMMDQGLMKKLLENFSP